MALKIRESGRPMIRPDPWVDPRSKIEPNLETIHNMGFIIFELSCVLSQFNLGQQESMLVLTKHNSIQTKIPNHIKKTHLFLSKYFHRIIEQTLI